MPMPFIFEEEDKIDRSNLLQGDILQRTESLRSVIRNAHPYYADTADDYDFFMVLTQSCDLVIRRGRPPKSHYITLAAIRPLDVVMERLLQKAAEPIKDFPIIVCRKQNETNVRQYLERLLHNTVDGFFFIRKNSHPAIRKDYCVFLALSIALRAEHYGACLDAKVAQLKDVFQAKIGWLAENLYSRVGTPDISTENSDPKTYKEDFIREVLDQTVWVTPEQRSQLVELAKVSRTDDISQAKALVDQLKDDRLTVAERIADRLIKDVLKKDDLRDRIIKLIASDSVVAKVILRNQITDATVGD